MYDYEYEYYNISLNNLDNESTINNEPHLVFNETRSDPIIYNCEEYQMAVDNYKIDLKNLPIITVTIQPNSNINLSYEDKHRTIYKIGVVYTHNNIKYLGIANVIFEPQDKTISVPNFIDGKPYYKSNYYNIYNYEWFIRLLNKAIIVAINNLKTILTTNSIDITFIKDEIPYFGFEKELI
jgi:hypothetical protein